MLGAWSKSLADYKTKYIGRRNKRPKARTSGYRLIQFFKHSVTYFCTIFVDPLPSFNWWAVSVGGEELKWRQLAHHQLMSPQGHYFSPHSKAKANYKSTNLRELGN